MSDGINYREQAFNILFGDPDAPKPRGVLYANKPAGAKPIAVNKGPNRKKRRAKASKERNKQ